MIAYENTRTIRDMLEKSVEEFRETSFLRYERDDLIYDISY